MSITKKKQEISRHKKRQHNENYKKHVKKVINIAGLQMVQLPDTLFKITMLTMFKGEKKC